MHGISISDCWFRCPARLRHFCPNKFDWKTGCEDTPKQIDEISPPLFREDSIIGIISKERSYQAYKNPNLSITFWRTSTGREVDFILGNKQLAINIKGSSRVHKGSIWPLLALLEDGPVKKCCVVCLEKEPRWIHPSIEVIPWRMFLDRLWKGDFGV